MRPERKQVRTCCDSLYTCLQMLVLCCPLLGICARLVRVDVKDGNGVVE